MTDAGWDNPWQEGDGRGGTRMADTGKNADLVEAECWKTPCV